MDKKHPTLIVIPVVYGASSASIRIYIWLTQASFSGLVDGNGDGAGQEKRSTLDIVCIDRDLLKMCTSITRGA